MNLDSLARRDSSKRGWLHAKVGCRLAAELIGNAEKLLAPDVDPYPTTRMPPGEESVTPLVKWRRGVRDHVVCVADVVRQAMADEVGRQLEKREKVHTLPTLVIDASTLHSFSRPTLEQSEAVKALLYNCDGEAVNADSRDEAIHRFKEKFGNPPSDVVPPQADLFWPAIATALKEQEPAEEATWPCPVEEQETGDNVMCNSLEERGCNSLGEAFGYWREGHAEVGQFLMPCSDDDAALPILKRAAASWHHLANRLNDEVVVAAVNAIHRLDEPDSTSQPSNWAEPVNRALGNPQRYWPVIAESLVRKIELDKFEAEKLLARLEAKWTKLAAAGNGQAYAHSLIRDRCRSAIALLFAAQEWERRRPDDPAPQVDDSATVDRNRKPRKAKRSHTQRGDQKKNDDIILAAVAAHHGYEANGRTGSVSNSEPIKIREIERTLKEESPVSVGTIKNWFDRKFLGHDSYKKLCAKGAGDLAAELHLMHGNFCSLGAGYESVDQVEDDTPHVEPDD